MNSNYPLLSVTTIRAIHFTFDYLILLQAQKKLKDFILNYYLLVWIIGVVNFLLKQRYFELRDLEIH